jgi:hypothetical protein
MLARVAARLRILCHEANELRTYLFLDVSAKGGTDHNLFVLVLRWNPVRDIGIDDLVERWTQRLHGVAIPFLSRQVS